MRITRLASAAFVALATLAPAPPATAGMLASAELRLHLISSLSGPLASVTYPGPWAEGSASSPASVSLAAGTGFAGVTFAGSIVTTEQLHPFEVRAQILSNATGSFSGSPLSGTGLFSGRLYFREIGVPNPPVHTLPIMLGSPGPHTWNETIVITAQRFRTGVVTAGGTGGPPQIILTGSNQLTPEGGGSLLLVTPFAITAPGKPWGTFIGAAELELHFIPEPGAGAMFGSAALALLVAGRRRVRR